ncbi:DNA polymerase [Microbulbifer sp. JSM ZJ756]|uniref:DNA polymerase n=1 Tax=Microbulbifer sp. JSM ZJ756 TaxID=3376191 RepID=UPI0037AF5C32
MNEERILYLVYQKDFSESGYDRYFLFDGEAFSEVSSQEVVALDCILVTHDFWLIASSLHKKHESLPSNVLDVVLLSKIVAGVKSVDGSVQPWEISKTIKPLFKLSEDFDSYMDIYYRRTELTMDVYMLFSHKLAEYFEQLSARASDLGEADRFYSLELPVFNQLTLSACRGIRIDKDVVKAHKVALKLDFYRQLKLFAEKHKVLYEIPNEGEIREVMGKLGYSIQDYSLDFMIDFLPSRDGYTEDLRSLQKVNKSYRVFNSISSGSSRLRPIVESHWTSTSRIYHKSPSLQNISKKYRNIFIPDEGMSLCYVDYDQFEIGIMAALSSDSKMKSIYEEGDAYKDLAVHIFDDESMRKKAKVMFLSYTYGMSIENIVSSVRELGGSQRNARAYFSEFAIFEDWKEKLNEKFLKDGKIPTISANYLNRSTGSDSCYKGLTEKEKRTSVNHVIQGTATYIFKKALLELSKIDSIQILIPMHDAVLFQHPKKVDPDFAVKIFEDVMTTELAGKVAGKASIEEFYAK